MCLAVPGQIVTVGPDDPLGRTARVDFGGVIRDISLACTPDAQVGDWVIVHAGLAIAKLDPQAARTTLEYLGDVYENGLSGTARENDSNA
jgi:hydrogenase expression/formation protein HypC